VKVPNFELDACSLIEQVATGSTVGVAVAVAVGFSIGTVIFGVPLALIPQMVRDNTKTPLLAPIRVCFKNSNLGFSELKLFLQYGGLLQV
jgi:hypothetical protein